MTRHAIQITFEICAIRVCYINDWFYKKIFFCNSEWSTIYALALLSYFYFGSHYVLPNPNLVSDNVDSFLIIEYHFYISDDCKHDSYFCATLLAKALDLHGWRRICPLYSFCVVRWLCKPIQVTWVLLFLGCCPNLIDGCAMI